MAHPPARNRPYHRTKDRPAPQRPGDRRLGPRRPLPFEYEHRTAAAASPPMRGERGARWRLAALKAVGCVRGEKRASGPSAALALLSSRQASVRFTVMPRIGFRLAPYSSHRCCRPLSGSIRQGIRLPLLGN
jgi:hypothetical protein